MGLTLTNTQRFCLLQLAILSPYSCYDSFECFLQHSESHKTLKHIRIDIHPLHHRHHVLYASHLLQHLWVHRSLQLLHHPTRHVSTQTLRLRISLHLLHHFLIYPLVLFSGLTIH